MGAAGAGALGQVVNAAIAGKDRFETMRDFFEGVGQGDTAGVWEGTPEQKEGFRAKQERKLALAAKRAADLKEPVGC